ncbi:MAG: hypothetical protein A3E87_05250 [Gammaproteobacteria bacterium RIFCSPHIGHO2_12_FULL_35_23]|nr:MAG: hypothetical protein A3E87_05250 [Gammaproteobacteria bacterium RIFCSPHIGHO2_12_FULL_35_23]
MTNMLNSELIINCTTAFIITFLCIKLCIRPAYKIGLVDSPGGRKQHSKPVPLIGGVCMFFGFCFSILTLNISLLPYRSLLASGALLSLVGMIDDMHELTPQLRIIFQLVAALLMTTWGGLVLRHFGNFFTLGNLYLGEWGIILTIIAVVGMINAVNMLDGIDGLAGGTSFIQLSLLCYLALHVQRSNDAKVLLLLAVVVLAFLIFNFPRLNKSAQVFMGDAGSMWLGFALTWFCVSLSQGPIVAANPVTFVWIMAIPILDLSSVVIRRLMKKQSPFKADRQHFHHLLQNWGYSSFVTTLIISFLSLLLGIIGLILNHFMVPGYISIIGFLLLFLIYHWLINHNLTS